MEKPLVSVVITTYNRSAYLKKAIQNVLQQGYQPLEVVVVDDASSDDTWQTILEYSNQDMRVRGLRNEKNLKVAESANKGIAASSGKYIAIIDDDDEWIDKEKLEKQVVFLETHPDYVLVGGGAVWRDENGREILRYHLPEDDKEIREQILVDNCFVHSAVVFRKSDFEKTAKYKAKFGVSCDWGIFLELGKLGKFYNFQEYFVNHLVWSKNISSLNIRRIYKMQLEIRNEYRMYYPGYVKSLLLGWMLYFSTFLPFREKVSFSLPRLRKLLFGKPSYDKKKN